LLKLRIWAAPRAQIRVPLYILYTRNPVSRSTQNYTDPQRCAPQMEQCRGQWNPVLGQDQDRPRPLWTSRGVQLNAPTNRSHLTNEWIDNTRFKLQRIRRMLYCWTPTTPPWVDSGWAKKPCAISLEPARSNAKRQSQ